MITNPVLPTPNSGSAENAGVGLIQKLVPYAITWGFVIGVVVFFFVFIMGAIKWISSGGDKEKVSKARDTITSALIGLVVLFVLYAIIRLIGVVFFDKNDIFLQLTIPTLPQ